MKHKESHKPQAEMPPPFDITKIDSFWIEFSNQIKKDYFTVTVEINGFRKVLVDFYIPGLDPEEGHCLQSHNLTWLVKT